MKWVTPGSGYVRSRGAHRRPAGARTRRAPSGTRPGRGRAARRRGFRGCDRAERGHGGVFLDEGYREAGASVSEAVWDADAVAKVRKPSPHEVGRLRSGQVLVGFLEPLTDQAGIERLAERGVHAFAMESIPRITRAQPMDA